METSNRTFINSAGHLVTEMDCPIIGVKGLRNCANQYDTLFICELPPEEKIKEAFQKGHEAGMKLAMFIGLWKMLRDRL